MAVWCVSVCMQSCKSYVYVMLLILVVDGDNEGDDNGEGGSEGRGSILINLQYPVFYTEWDLSSMYAIRE